MDWTPETIGMIQAVIALVLTVVTAVYVVITAKILGETRRQREQASRPNIIAYLRPHEAMISLVYLRFENTGLGSAHSVSVTLSGIRKEMVNANIDSHGLFKKGLAVFPPGAKLDVFLFSAIEKWEQVKDLKASVQVCYSSDIDTEYCQDFPLDFSQLEGYERVGKPPLYDIAKSAERLSKTVEAWPFRHQRLEVNTHTPRDVEEEQVSDNIYFSLRRLSASSRERVQDLVNRLLEEERGDG